MKKLYAHDWGKYIGLYKRRSCTESWGAVLKDNKKCMDEWEELQRTHEIEWV